MPGATDKISRRRVVIEHVKPELDAGRFAIKRIAGDHVAVEADIFAEGHDELAARILYRCGHNESWQEAPLRLQGNDHWQGDFSVDQVGSYTFKIEAWVDRYGTWRRDLARRVEAGQDIEVELITGSQFLRAAMDAAPPDDAERLDQRAEVILRQDWPQTARAEIALEPTSSELMSRYGSREPMSVYDVGQRITVDRERAGFSAWYELFPRSTSPDAGYHGNFKTAIDWLPYVAGMGFDVLYFPPIHPIGEVNRKGPNNSETSEKGDFGSPWAIGSKLGGHTAVNPDLGTLADFKALVAAAGTHGLEVALDIAYQCAPDHPWVKEHPTWFKHRADGSIRYAENPPKLYQDIYPINFETSDREELWQALEDVVRFWIAQGVKIFRVDNPHTKPFAFWEQMIGNIKADYPDVLFLSEAFTRPRIMEYLAKLGFTQSYTYFTWRNNKWELETYLEELTESDVREYLRPNFWPNTPDILHAYLQHGGRPAFVTRLVLAATLSTNYGIYGPVFELCVNTAREPNSEEYLDSEKYEVQHWDLWAQHSIREVITHVNRARRENPALQHNGRLRFLDIDSSQVLAYIKTSPDGSNRILGLVNLDPRAGQSGTLWLPLQDLGLPWNEDFAVDDLLRDTTESWRGDRHIINLHPTDSPVRLLRLRPYN